MGNLQSSLCLVRWSHSLLRKDLMKRRSSMWTCLLHTFWTTRRPISSGFTPESSLRRRISRRTRAGSIGRVSCLEQVFVFARCHATSPCYSSRVRHFALAADVGMLFSQSPVWPTAPRLSHCPHSLVDSPLAGAAGLSDHVVWMVFVVIRSTSSVNLPLHRQLWTSSV